MSSVTKESTRTSHARTSAPSSNSSSARMAGVAELLDQLGEHALAPMPQRRIVGRLDRAAGDERGRGWSASAQSSRSAISPGVGERGRVPLGPQHESLEPVELVDHRGEGAGRAGRAGRAERRRRVAVAQVLDGGVEGTRAVRPGLAEVGRQRRADGGDPGAHAIARAGRKSSRNTAAASQHGADPPAREPRADRRHVARDHRREDVAQQRGGRGDGKVAVEHPAEQDHEADDEHRERGDDRILRAQRAERDQRAAGHRERRVGDEPHRARPAEVDEQRQRERAEGGEQRRLLVAEPLAGGERDRHHDPRAHGEPQREVPGVRRPPRERAVKRARLPGSALIAAPEVTGRWCAAVAGQPIGRRRRGGRRLWGCAPRAGTGPPHCPAARAGGTSRAWNGSGRLRAACGARPHAASASSAGSTTSSAACPGRSRAGGRGASEASSRTSPRGCGADAAAWR